MVLFKDEPDDVVGHVFFCICYDDGVDDKIIILSTPEAKTKIKTVDTFYGDGTFRVVPNPFYQLYYIDTGNFNCRKGYFDENELYIYIYSESA